MSSREFDHVPATLTADQDEQMRRLRLYFPYRIIYGVVDKDTGEFTCYAVLDMRKPNRLAREGHAVFLLGGGGKGQR